MSHNSIDALMDVLTSSWLSLRAQTAQALYQIHLDLPLERPLSTLLSVPSDRKVYWQSRDDQTECVGLGMAMEVTTSRPQDVPEVWCRVQTLVQQGDRPIRFYGGMAFDRQQAPDALWSPMGLIRFWVPQVLIQRAGDGVQLIVSTPTLDDASLAQVVRLITAALQTQIEPAPTLPTSVCHENLPSKSQWMDRVTEVTRSLTQAQGKVVLSVRQDHTLDRHLEAFQLFQHIRSQSQGGFQYFFQVEDTAFMGISPECLYERQGASLATEALAGTAKLDGGVLDTPKENCEHDFVIQDMKEALAKVCLEVLCQPNKEWLAWQDLVHLKTALAGILRTDVTDAQVIEALHPSAAVLGYPRDKAWQWLSAYEDHARGWYAGPVGWLDRDQAQFAVALRCALAISNTIYLYAGAGLVQASLPQEEWQEVQNKMQLFDILES